MIVDRAVGELALLEASLAQYDQLAALFKEIGDRPISGSATEFVQVAREQLNLVGKADAHLFNCGPLALYSLLRTRGVPDNAIGFVAWQQVGPSSTSLADLERLADQAKFKESSSSAPGQKFRPFDCPGRLVALRRSLAKERAISG